MKGADLVGPCLAVYEPLLVLWGRSLGPPILSPSENVKVARGRKEGNSNRGTGGQAGGD